MFFNKYKIPVNFQKHFVPNESLGLFYGVPGGARFISKKLHMCLKMRK